MLRGTAKIIKATYQICLNLQVNKLKGCLEGLPEIKKNVPAKLSFAKLQVNKVEDVWNNALWIDKATMEMSAIMHKTKHSLMTTNTPYQLSSTVMKG